MGSRRSETSNEKTRSERENDKTAEKNRGAKYNI